MAYDFGDLAEPAKKGYDFGDLAAPVAASSDQAVPARQSPMQMLQVKPVDPSTSRLHSFGAGLRDLTLGGAQLIEHALPKAAQIKMDEADAWLAKKTGGMLGGEEPLDDYIKKRESDLSSERAAAGREGVDWARAGGNIVNPLNIALAARFPQLATTLGRVAVGGMQGGLTGAVAPVVSGDYWDEKAKQVGAGAAMGGAIPLSLSGLARIIRPNASMDEAVQTLRKAGVAMTPGQVAGGAVRSMEERLAGYPVVGEIIKSSERRGLESFDKASLNKALEHIGESVPKSVPAGRDAVEAAYEKISGRYDDLLPKLKGSMDKDLVTELGAVRQLGHALRPDIKQQLDSILQAEVVGKFTPQGLATGTTLKKIESRLGEMASRLRGSRDYNEAELGNALREVQESLRRMVERQNPQYRGELQKVNAAFRDYVRSERASTMLGAKEGVFTPNQLMNAVKALDTSRNKRAFAFANAPMQDLASAGQKVLSSTVPDSGTAGRLAAGLMLESPKRLGLPLVAGALAAPFYSPAGQKAVETLLAARPHGANALAQLVRRGGPALTAAGVPLALVASPSEAP